MKSKVDTLTTEEELANLLSKQIADEVDNAIIESFRLLGRTPEQIKEDEADEIVKRLKEGIKKSNWINTPIAVERITVTAPSRKLTATWSVEEPTDTYIIRKTK